MFTVTPEEYSKIIKKGNARICKEKIIYDMSEFYQMTLNPQIELIDLEKTPLGIVAIIYLPKKPKKSINTIKD